MQQAMRRRRRTGSRVAAALLAAALLIPLVVVARELQVARRDDHPPADALVVLGAAQYNGNPGELLRARLEHALRLYREGVAPVIVTTGGSASGDASTEGFAGGDWLAAHGVPWAALALVTEGSDTRSSLRAVATLAEQRGWTTVVLVSDPWHMYRAQAMADDLGLDVVGTSPVSSGPSVSSGRRKVVTYVARETAAFLDYRLGTIVRRLT